ncbi:hypothetical protein [Saccharopolyspora shandongensis]|uniref:hypothetical protein n=1 Tax=Saccharopolyspora shandongensis TaxID=418495 RepID=UPI00340BA4A8
MAIDLAERSADHAEKVFSARARRATAAINRLSRDIQCLWAPAGTADVQRYRLWQTATGTAKSSWSQRFAHH